MICGWQISSGGWGRPMEFCAERKADGLPTCQDHWDDLVVDGDTTAFAPGNAVGDPHWAVRLLWEGEEPGLPIEASAEEMALYAPILGLVRGA
jgi:hypothetical protein